MHYIPKPVDTTGVTLTQDIIALTEMLAKNAHDIWARQRLSEGWKYGIRRDDAKKEHPCLVAYEDLPEQEKEYDRNAALETLKVIKVLGYTLGKVQPDNR